MKDKKILYIIFFTIVVGACLWAFLASSVITHKFKKEIFSEAKISQKLNINNLVVIETKDNKKHWEMFADSGNYHGGSKEAILTGIIGNFYQNEVVTVSFKANEGIFNEDSKRITLNKDAIIVYKDGTYVQADKFIWEGTNNNIQALGRVKIVKPKEATIFGEKAFLSNELTDFEIVGKTKTDLYDKGNIK